jgi:hypothetical protein
MHASMLWIKPECTCNGARTHHSPTPHPPRCVHPPAGLCVSLTHRWRGGPLVLQAREQILRVPLHLMLTAGTCRELAADDRVRAAFRSPVLQDSENSHLVSVCPDTLDAWVRCC